MSVGYLFEKSLRLTITAKINWKIKVNTLKRILLSPNVPLIVIKIKPSSTNQLTTKCSVLQQKDNHRHILQRGLGQHYPHPQSTAWLKPKCGSWHYNKCFKQSFKPFKLRPPLNSIFRLRLTLWLILRLCWLRFIKHRSKPKMITW